jgi:hypothetical protein
MYLYSNKVIPIDAMLRGEKPDLKLIIENAKEYPAHFVGELLAMGMMVLGAYTAAGWAYEAGRWVGRLIG